MICRSVAVGFLLLSWAGTAAAQEDFSLTPIIPTTALGSDIADIARQSAQSADGTAEGGGRWLRVSYESPVPLTGFVAPMRGEAYNPVDLLRFDLPPTSGIPDTVGIDLSVSPSWNPLSKTYFLSFASPASEVLPSVFDVAIMDWRGGTVGPFFSHLARSESFVISTYHMLRGYRVLGFALLPILGVLALAACAAALLRKRTRTAPVLLAIVLCAHLFYGARVGIDLVRLSVTHAEHWFDEHLYAEGGSMYDLAETVPSDARLAVCFDSTDYFAKLLRYLLLPIPVQIGSNGDLLPTHVAVIRKIAWSYDNGILKCGTIDAPATLVREFPDGSRLFSLTTP